VLESRDISTSHSNTDAIFEKRKSDVFSKRRISPTAYNNHLLDLQCNVPLTSGFSAIAGPLVTNCS